MANKAIMTSQEIFVEMSNNTAQQVLNTLDRLLCNENANAFWVELMRLRALQNELSNITFAVNKKIAFLKGR